MLIVDAGVHVWLPSTPQRPWSTAPDAGKAHASELRWQDLEQRMAAAGVHRAVLVSPSWVGEDNSYALDAARSSPRTFAVMGRLAPDRPQSLELLSNWRRQWGMLGVRLVLRPGLPWLHDGSADGFWSAAEASEIPIMLAPLGHWELVERILTRHPALRIVIDHLGCGAGQQDAAAFAHLPQLLRLARFANLAVKVSAMPSYSSQPYPFSNLHGYVRQAFDAFGARRVFWGSDLSRLSCSYREAVTMFTEELSLLDGGAMEWVMGRGICDWLGWDIGNN